MNVFVVNCGSATLKYALVWATAAVVPASITTVTEHADSVLPLAEGMLDMPGVNPPEAVGKSPAAVDRMLAEFKKRNVKIVTSIREL